MRKLSVVLIVVVLSACFGSRTPMNFSGPAPASVAATFDCANRTLSEMNYTVVAAERESGLLRAERRNQASMASVIMGGKDTFDELTVNIIRGQPNNTMRITAGSSLVGSRDRTPADPSRRAQEDAKRVLSTCATAS